jgi:hypothetical protein
VSDKKDKLSFADACRELQISQDELERLVADGEIVGIKEGDTITFKSDVIAQFKKSRKTEPTIILSDDELDLLDGVDEIQLDDLELGDDETSGLEPAAAARQSGLSIDDDASLGGEGKAGGGDAIDLDDLDISSLSLDDDAPATEDAGTVAATPETVGVDDDLDLTLEDDISLDAPAAASTGDTVLNLDGLLDEESDSESTTPVPGGDMEGLELVDTNDDITLEGSITDDDTILDTDVLDLGADDGAFRMDAGVAGGDPTASTLLRGGGSRVMQMKRVKGHPVMTAVLAVTALLLIPSMAVVTTVLHFDKTDVAHPADDPSGAWIKDTSGSVKSVVESTADSVYDAVGNPRG